MAHQSDPAFCTFHALRIKGFASAATLADMTARDDADVVSHLDDFHGRQLVQFRERQAMWQLTPAGREAHRVALAADIDGAPLESIQERYRQFLTLNEQFKMLCTDWQMRDGAINDHSDPAYDTDTIARLTAFDTAARPIVAAMGEYIIRFAPYANRLLVSHERLLAGNPKMFTGVMCGSYHDVWMELHEDLILTQSIDRAAEGSF
jgi:hypothetical protein